MKRVKASLAFLLMFFLLAGSSFAQVRVPLQEALDAMVSDSAVTVTSVPGEWPDPRDPAAENYEPFSYDPQYYYEFKPVGITPQDGFIILPGGNVAAEAYAVIARAIAKAGFLAVLVPAPDYGTLTGLNRVDTIIENNAAINTWTIGGHSFGGVCASWYMSGAFESLWGPYNQNNKIDAVVFWGSYPAANLSGMSIKVLSLWGTEDTLNLDEETGEMILQEALMPADANVIALEGANHTQFGWYGENATDYDYLSVKSSNASIIDNPAGITREEQHDLILGYTVNFLDSLMINIPAAVDQVTADDGSIWERVSLHGFVDPNNIDIVALTPYNGNLYALTRNDVSGFELWKTDPAQGWQRIHVQGFTDQSDYSGYLQNPDLSTPALLDLLPSEPYSPYMNIWADMIEFKGHLYVAVSTGHQGSALFGSRGAFIWRTDGVAWEPVIGGHEPVAEGTLSAISSCDGTTSTAVFTDSSQNWTEDLTGCIVTVESEFSEAIHGTVGGDPVPGKRLFKIVSNTVSTMTVEQNEKAQSAENTRCDETLEGGFDWGRPKNNLSGFETGAAYTISCGPHSPGFGDPWNKSIIDFEILNNELFASIGLNYEQGARVMRTSDGLNWEADSPYSFGNIHGYDIDGVAFETCPDQDQKYTTRDIPVSSSATKMFKTSIAGQETLFIGGTGTGGCNGRGARIYRRDAEQVWTPVVDVAVDEDAEGTNENAFGYDSTNPYTGNKDFMYSAFQAWSWAEYDGNLLVGVTKLEAGGMIFSTPGPVVEEDGAWAFSMGGQFADREKDAVTNIADSSEDPEVNGFGDPLNTGVYLYNYNDTVYAGTMVTNLSSFVDNPLNGADLWKGTGAGDSITWSRVVGDGFGDSTVLQFQAFADYADNMYMVASTVNPSNFPGQEPDGATGAVVYRLAVEAPECMVDDDCIAWSTCEENVCVPVSDDPPAITGGPFLAAGTWPVLPTDSAGPVYLEQNEAVLWTFSDDYAAGCEDCTHVAEYQAVGAAGWTSLAVTSDKAQGYAHVQLPITSLINATTYAFRFSVTDCATPGQSAQSQTYYFRVATEDAPPTIESGPFLATGWWPVLSKTASQAFVISQDEDVLWSFDDDYATCSDMTWHRARYHRIVEDGTWVWEWLEVNTDSTEKEFAYVRIPASSMEAGTYRFVAEIIDCAGQLTRSTTYFFKVGGEVIEPECVQTSDCLGIEECIDGQCIEIALPEECQENSDCPGTDECIEWQCVPAPE